MNQGLREYDKKQFPEYALTPADRELAKTLGGKVEIIAPGGEGVKGLEIRTKSYVGHLTLECGLDLVITPKFDHLATKNDSKSPSPLLQLLQYTFNLDDLIVAGQQISPTPHFAEILTHALLNEVHTIRRRGPFQQYQQQHRDLSSLRGKVEINTWLRRGGVPSATLPCRFYRRSLDNALNQVICAGLRTGAQLAQTSSLESDCRFLADTFALHVTEKPLCSNLVADAFHELNRLNAHYTSALQLAKLLYEGIGGFVHGEEYEDRISIPGFLFDMNKLFETVLGKFLKENLPSQYKVKLQKTYGVYSYNPPNKRECHCIKPDFVVTEKSNGKTSRNTFDAKYINIDAKKGPSTSVLYQLTVYALACSEPEDTEQGVERRATILYPGEPNAKPKKLTLKREGDGKKLCQIALQPVDLLRLAHLVSDETGADKTKAREQYALELIDR